MNLFWANNAESNEKPSNNKVSKIEYLSDSLEKEFSFFSSRTKKPTNQEAPNIKTQNLGALKGS